MKFYEELNLKEIKKNYDYGDLSLLEYLKDFIPNNENDELNKLLKDVLNYNEIYANGWTINTLFEMGKDDEYWKNRAEHFIKKYNVRETEYGEYSVFFDRYKELFNDLLTNMGIDNHVLDMEINKIPEKGFIDIDVLTSTSELDEEHSFTVSRVMNLCHCVELHYYKGEATVEYGTKIKYDYWESDIDDIEWFNKNMNDGEVINKLKDLFIDYFGEEEYVLMSSNDKESLNMM